MEQALAPAVRLDLYPKSTIDVVVTVLEADGNVSSLAASLLGASLALADAGVEMVDLVVATTVVSKHECYFIFIPTYYAFVSFIFLCSPFMIKQKLWWMQINKKNDYNVVG